MECVVLCLVQLAGIFFHRLWHFEPWFIFEVTKDLVNQDWELGVHIRCWASFHQGWPLHLLPGLFMSLSDLSLAFFWTSSVSLCGCLSCFWEHLALSRLSTFLPKHKNLLRSSFCSWSVLRIGGDLLGAYSWMLSLNAIIVSEDLCLIHFEPFTYMRSESLGHFLCWRDGQTSSWSSDRTIFPQWKLSKVRWSYDWV